MQTSQQWWDAVKADPALFTNWLLRQYTGEVTAAERIVALGERYQVDEKTSRLLGVIAGQEALHATWIKELLEARGITPEIGVSEARYWAETLPGIDSFDTGAAVAAHAEKMRLDRIQVIANDVDAPDDVRETFKRILRDELFHERAFREMASQDAMNRTMGNHELGMAALGLTH